MRFLRITLPGEDWNDEHEAEEKEQEVQDALDAAGVEYIDIDII